MVRLKLDESYIQKEPNKYLHSTMVRLKLKASPGGRGGYQFTFHYG